MSSVPKTDVVRRAPLDTGLLRAPRQGAESSQTSDEYLAHIEEEWNKKIDVEIDTLVSGMTALVDIASVRLSQASFSTS
jgi:mediator of RNA polymerase II transcription subunit 22